MKLTPAWFVGRLDALDVADARRFIVAFSGGLDSSVLLHLAVRSTLGNRVSAVHVDHGLSAHSGDWARHCQRVCEALETPIRVLRAEVGDGPSPEAAAREARYAVLEPLIEEGTCLLTAHHEDDQAETVILNLMRASGPLGLSAIPARRALGGGLVVRPLLGVDRAVLRDYAAAEDLSFVEDDSNTDLRHDRNFLRHEVLPLLESRFPNAAKRLSRSALLLAEASDLLDALAARDLVQCGGDPRRIGLEALRQLGADRQRNLLRYVLRRDGLPPGAGIIDAVQNDLLDAREDAQPLVQFGHASIRRFRDTLYVVMEDEPSPSPLSLPSGTKEVELGDGVGRLRLEEAGEGIDPGRLDRGFEIRYRAGGESIRLAGQGRKLKKLLQDARVVPWMRRAIPLLVADGEIVAVADLFIDETALARPGLRVVWEDRPSIR